MSLSCYLLTNNCCYFSAGCGRTGALCVIDYTWNLLKKQVRYSCISTSFTLFTFKNSKAVLCWRVCVLVFSDDHSKFQYLWLSSKHENPEAFGGSNQGIYCFLFCEQSITRNKYFNKQNHNSGQLFMSGASFYQRYFDDSRPGAMSPNRAGFCCLTSGTIRAGLQNHQVTIWEIPAVHGRTDRQKCGELPGTTPLWLRTHKQ